MPASAESLKMGTGTDDNTGLRGTAITREPSAEAVSRLDALLHDVADEAAKLVRSMQEGDVDPRLADAFINVAREATRGSTMLELIREADRERQENETFARIGMHLSSAAGIENVLESILDALRQVVRFSSAAIFVYNRELGQIDLDLLEGYEGPEREKTRKKFQEGVKVGEGIVGSVIQSGEAIYVPDVRKDPRYIAARETTLSEVAVPIIARGEVIGAFNLESDDLDAFGDHTRRILSMLAANAGVALERARTDRIREQANRIQEEISLARRIQSSFLPRQMPSFKPYDLGGMNFPSSEVGGDYFDFIPITGDDLGIVVSDVTGHGVAAALMMANFRACMRIESRNNFAISTILSKVNDFLYETDAPDSFVTACYGVLSRKTHVFSYSNAGHNPPILMHADGRMEFLETGGLLLGAFPETHYEETTIRLSPGDILVLYTDGLTESQDESGREFGVERLQELIVKYKDLSALEIVRRISHDAHRFQSAKVGQDDLTLSIVKYGSTD